MVAPEETSGASGPPGANSTSRSVDNHFLFLLRASLKENADKYIFRPYIGRDDSWDAVTYRQLEQQLAVAKEHWRHALAPLNLRPLDVVGFWLTGSKFTDYVNSLAVSALGYTPQFFGGSFDDATHIPELLSRSSGRALIYDAVHQEKVAAESGLSVPQFAALNDTQIAQATSNVFKDGADSIPPASLQAEAAVALDDIAFLFHSSGTTGGRPKIIPNTFKMLHAVIKRKLIAVGVTSQVDNGEQFVINNIGGLVNPGSFHTFVGSIYAGGCVVQSSPNSVTPQEFVGMTRVCSLNRLAVFSTFLSNLIRAAKHDDAVKHALQGLHSILHTGVAINPEDEEWARANGLKVINAYSTSETGPLLRARSGTDADAHLLRPIDGSTAVFLPREDSFAGVQLYEVAVPVSSDECPPPEVCGVDGYYHTKDLFSREGDGWVYRGRADDWLKVGPGLCDSKSMENLVQRACSDLVHNVVVVGTRRPLPALIVESTENTPDEEAQRVLAKEVVRRIKDHMHTFYPHERIEDPRKVLVVGKGSLPRTREKGNVRYALTFFACMRRSLMW
ncbi:acetyl-CoA synthetase-like protein [Trametes elegans]|nr:acetyl-CoA synthetase-like protein [Trametes elegans]